MLAHILQQYGEIWNEPENATVSYGHSDIEVTLNTYTHLGLEDAEDELKRLEDMQNAKKELERTQGEKPVSQKLLVLRTPLVREEFACKLFVLKIIFKFGENKMS